MSHSSICHRRNILLIFGSEDKVVLLLDLKNEAESQRLKPPCDHLWARGKEAREVDSGADLSGFEHQAVS